MNHFFRQPPALLASRIALAFVWIYQGIVPKLVCQSPIELGLLAHLGPMFGFLCSVMGYGEMLFGVLLLLSPWRWPFLLNIAAMLGLFGYVSLTEPSLLVQPFNPVTLNVALIALSITAILSMPKSEA
ncbi:MAG: hypothetical protein HGB06_07125 [Chlorobaculum sp.]|jgi:hypothetical protein|nr:hypothetical protein [Chlorobaculum sp.]